jgi:hypothetical protein
VFLQILTTNFDFTVGQKRLMAKSVFAEAALNKHHLVVDHKKSYGKTVFCRDPHLANSYLT